METGGHAVISDGVVEVGGVGGVASWRGLAGGGGVCPVLHSSMASVSLEVPDASCRSPPSRPVPLASSEPDTGALRETLPSRTGPLHLPPSPLSLSPLPRLLRDRPQSRI